MIKGRQNKVHQKSIKTKHKPKTPKQPFPQIFGFFFFSLCKLLQHDNLQQPISVPEGKNRSWEEGRDGMF